MRLNKYLAQATGLSRRAADHAIGEGRVRVDGQPAHVGHILEPKQRVELDGKPLAAPRDTVTILLNKPTGYICSRQGQGGKTIYDLLPGRYHHLKPVGRLDKDSSGLLLLTNDGQRAYELTHPSFQKTKIYEVRLDKRLIPEALRKLEKDIMLEDGISKLDVRDTRHASAYEVRMAEGRNRQIRRTFAHLGYHVTRLHRTRFGPYALDHTLSGKWRSIAENTSPYLDT